MLVTKPIFTAKIKLMGGLGMVGVIGISAPMSLAVIDETTKTSVNDLMSRIADKANSEISSHVSDMPGEFKKTYEEAWNGAETHLTTSKDKLTTEYTNGVNQAKGYYTLATSHADNANYYLFEFEPFIKSFLNYFPIIIEESIFESFKGEEDSEEFLSFQKLTAIATNEKIFEALNGLADVATKYHDKLSAMSYSDSHGLMSIIRELKNNKNDIESWLEKIKNNSEEIKNDSTEEYCTTTKLLMHLLIGKSSVNGIKEKVTAVEGIMEKLKSLQNVLKLDAGALDKFENSIKKLKTQSSDTKWVDPCPNPTTSDSTASSGPSVN